MRLSVATGIPYDVLASESDRVLATYFDVVKQINKTRG